MSEKSDITLLADGAELFNIVVNLGALDAGPAIVDVGPKPHTYAVTLTVRQVVELARRVADEKLKTDVLRVTYLAARPAPRPQH